VVAKAEMRRMPPAKNAKLSPALTAMRAEANQWVARRNQPRSVHAERAAPMQRRSSTTPRVSHLHLASLQ